MIKIENVTKRYYTLTALDNVSLTIPRGEVVGLLGPNGAGKTTLFKLIAGILQADEGEIRPFANGWPRIGYKPERLLFPNQLRVIDYLNMVAGLANVSARQQAQTVRHSLERVDLLSAANKRIRDCSKGMRQRLGLAQALIGDPPLLLLDEPSNGLDPSGQVEIHRQIQALHGAGKTIVMSSHQLHEVTQVCTQLVILNNGRIHYRNSMAEALAVSSHVAIQVERPLGAMGPFLKLFHPDIHIEGDTVRLRNEAMRLRRQIILTLLQRGFDVTHVEEKRISLAEIYARAVQ